MNKGNLSRKALLVLGALAAAALAIVGAGSAASKAKPSNTTEPSVSGSAVEGQTLTGDQGKWSGNPTDYNYYWTRCDKSGNSCSNISGATAKTYKLGSADVGNTIRFKVRAKNADGITFASSVPTAVVTAAPAPTPTPAPSSDGCPSGSGPIQVSQLQAPARLLVDGQQSSPNVVTAGTSQVVVRYHVTACNGRPVQGALVYSTATPFNQLNVPQEQPTDANGWAELDFHTLAGFPVSSKQRLIALFVRARKPGGNLLGGISTRRLVSVPVRLH